MRAKDVMTRDVVCIGIKESIFDAAEVLLGAGVSAAPVVDGKGLVIGIVSEADLLRRAEIGTAPARKSWLARLLASDAAAAHEFVSAHTRKVSDVMTRTVVTTSEDAMLADVVDLMEQHNVKRIPVVRDGKLLGIVSRSDILEALLSREPEGPAVQPSDQETRRAVVEALEKQPWATRWPTNVFANDGVVHLWGFVDDDEVRKAYRVAAENVPGVRKVKSHLRALPASVALGG
ncbi:MAG: CBS domain-containing protein [Reyranella sp.]|jgi:CBS domain-containing protein|nr:CBS domain-containing protein [Reyranella sp.]MBL6650142.1 CBS domain-containing protein [Reyranella sp.]